MPDVPLYSQLPHQRDIRLLRVKPGTGEEGIEVTLKTFELDSDTQFTALSYVWGDVIPPREIVCNGRKVPITRNLWCVLSQLRRQQFDRLLWVDAIRIDQKDEKEKSFQVAMMRDIYKRAENVIFWLGEQESHDEDAVSLMTNLFNRYPRWQDLEQHRVKTLEELGLRSNNAGWAGWSSLLSRPWFGRVWIVQEFLSAKNSVFMSGALKIPTELLVHFGFATGVCVAIREVVLCHSRDAHDTERAILRLQALAVDQLGRKTGGDGNIRIFDLWCRSQQLGATDPRDQVFALLSTQTAVGMDMINYNKDEGTVYTEIAATTLSIPVPRITWTGETSQTSHDLHRASRFLACKFRSPQSSSLPSWVPDWRPIGFSLVPLTRYYTGIASFTHPYSDATVKDKTLYISGTVLDEPHLIINSTPYMDSNWPAIRTTGVETRNWARAMSDWMYMCYMVAMSTRPRSVEHPRFERFCRAMAFGVRLEEAATSAIHYIKGFQTLFSRLARVAGEAYQYPSLLWSHSNQAGNSRMYESKICELSAGRKFCVTKKGYLAWVPVDTRPTDRICLLAGCAVPFVVRPVDKRYELLGDCYREDLIQGAGVEIGQEPQCFEFR